MKLLLLSRYSRLGASSRLRTLQYVPSLTAAGFDVEVAPFFDDDYLERLYLGERPRLETARYFAGRLRQLLSSRKADLLWVEKEAFPWLPWPIESAILPNSVPLVSDYDDAVFHRYDQHRSAFVRSLLAGKIDSVMASSQLVLAGNSYLADRAQVSGASKVEIVPTVIDTEAYSTVKKPDSDGYQRVGWIGTPVTWNSFAQPYFGIFSSILEKCHAKFRAVGAGLKPSTNGNLEIVPWVEAEEVTMIQSMEIGVMPLPDTPWARGKCGYKLIQYMGCGLPVVASPVGVNREIVEHGVNGFLAETDVEWIAALQTLLGDSDLRRRMGAEGRKKVEQEYSLQVHGPRVAKMLFEVARSGRRK